MMILVYYNCLEHDVKGHTVGVGQLKNKAQS